MTIRIDVKTTKKDYLLFQWHNIFTYAWIYLVLLCIEIPVLLILDYVKSKTGVYNAGIIAFSIIIAIIFVILLIRNVVDTLKCLKREKEKPEFQYTFTKGGLKCESAGKCFNVAWTDVYKVVEKRDMFMVFLRPESVIILPKRFFSNDNDIEEFRKNLLFAPKKSEKNKNKK